MSPDVRDRDKPARPRSRTPDERDPEVKRRKETIKREVSHGWGHQQCSIALGAVVVKPALVDVRMLFSVLLQDGLYPP